MWPPNGSVPTPPALPFLLLLLLHQGGSSTTGRGKRLYDGEVDPPQLQGDFGHHVQGRREEFLDSPWLDLTWRWFLTLVSGSGIARYERPSMIKVMSTFGHLSVAKYDITKYVIHPKIATLLHTTVLHLLGFTELASGLYLICETWQPWSKYKAMSFFL